jgi:hypothetical protein
VPGATPKLRGNVSLPTAKPYALTVPSNYVVVFSTENLIVRKSDMEM